MISRIAELLHDKRLATATLGFLGTVGFGGILYDQFSATTRPMHLPKGGSIVRESPASDTVWASVPAGEASQVDCGGKESPVPLLDQDNPRIVLRHIGDRALVQCDMVVDANIDW